MENQNIENPFDCKPIEDLRKEARNTKTWGVWRGILQERFQGEGLTDDELLERYRALAEGEQRELMAKCNAQLLAAAKDAKGKTAKEEKPKYSGFSEIADTLAATLPHPSIWAAVIVNMTVRPLDIKHFWHTVVKDFKELADNADDGAAIWDYIKEAAIKGKSYAQVYQDTERDRNAAYIFNSLTALGDIRTPPDENAPIGTLERWHAARREEEGITPEELTEETTRTHAYLVLLCLKARGVAERGNITPLAEGNGYNAVHYAKWNTKNPTEERGELTPIDFADGSRKLVTVFKDTVLLYEKYQGQTTLWRPSVKKLCDFTFARFTHQNNAIKRRPLLPIPDNEPDPRIKHSVVFEAGEFLALTHPDEANVIREREGERIKEDLECILRTCLTFTDYRIVTRKGKDGKQHTEQKLQKWTGIHLVSAADYDEKTGKVTINIAPEMAKSLLCFNYISQYDQRLLAVNEHLESFTIGRKLQEHYHNWRNRRRGTNNIISCKALYEVSQLPTEEKLKADYEAAFIARYPNEEERKGHRASRINYRQKMIEPFIKALRDLEQEIGLQWKFCREKGLPLRDKDRPEENIGDFMKCYVRFELLG